MTVLGPRIVCHKCGARLNITSAGKIPVHNVKGTNIPCIGSLEKPRS